MFIIAMALLFLPIFFSLYMTLILYRFLWILFCLIIIGNSGFFYSRRVHVLNFQLAFLLKLAAALVMTFIYTYFYPDRHVADIFRYFDDSNVLIQMFENNVSDFFAFITGHDNAALYKYKITMNNWESPGNVYNNNRVMIILNAAIGFISLGDYYVHLILFTFLSFVGLTAMFKVFNKIYKVYQGIVFISVFTLPSIIFWTSGVLKESLVMFALGIFLYSYMRFYFNSAIWYHLFSFALGFIILMLLKFYLLIILLPAMIILLLTQRILILQKMKGLTWILFSILFLLGLFMFKYINPRADALHALMNKREAFELLAHTMKAGSYFEVPQFNDIVSLLKAAPVALMEVIVRPNIFKISSPLVFLSALENIYIWILIVSALMFRKRNSVLIGQWNYFGLFVVIATFTLIGLTVPVEGAIVRYKSVVLPILMAILLCNIDYEKLFVRFPRIEKYFKL